MKKKREHTYNRVIAERKRSYLVAIPTPIIKMLNLNDRDRLEYVISEKTGAITIRKYEEEKEVIEK